MTKITSKVTNKSVPKVKKDEAPLKLFKGVTSGDVYVELPDGRHMRLSCRHPSWVGKVYDRYKDGSNKLDPFIGTISITAEA